MNNSVSDFLSTSLIPEIASNVTAGTPCNIHLTLVTVTTIWALPYQLAVIFNDFNLAVVAAALAVIGLGVQLGVHDVIIDELQHAYHTLFQT